MKTSPAGIKAIKSREGLRLFAYLDDAGVPTIGYGHTEGVFIGQNISEVRAEELLRADLEWAEEAVSTNVKVPLNQSQFDALVSFVFNIGAPRFRESTLLEVLNKGDYTEAAEQMLRWNKVTVRGELVKNEGLVNRRESEKAQFRSAGPGHPFPNDGPGHLLPEMGPAGAGQPTPNSPLRPDLDGVQTEEERKMPIPAIVGALLPAVVELIPRLASIFKPGSPVAERNVAAASTVLDIVTSATKAVNAQEAVEKLKTDPVALQTATKAIESRWFDLIPADGGGIEGARKADKEVSKGDLRQSPSFWFLILALPLVYMIVGSVTGLWGYKDWSDDVRASLATAVVSLIIGGAAGYFWGQVTSRNRTPG